MDQTILAYDLATCTGWCEGVPGGEPRYGSIRFAPAGSSTAAIFGGAIKTFVERLQAFRPRVVVFEAPFAPSVMRGKTNANTARILLGLPAILEGCCYRLGVHDLREVSVGDVRQHFLGTRKLRSAEAKRAVIERCRALGFSPTDDNAADAIAVWHYASALIDPRSAARSTPLFGDVRS